MNPRRCAEAVAALMAAHPTGDVCILGTQALLGLWRYHGHRGRPLEVGAFAFNAMALRHITEHGGVDPDTWLTDGSWSVAIDVGGDAAPGRFAGHLVAELDGQVYDTTAAQLGRPERGILVPQLVVTETGTGVELDAGGLLTYVDVPQTGGWRVAPDAGENGLARQLVAGLVRGAA